METKRKQTKKELFLEILRFLIVGGTATVFDYIVFWLFDGVLFPLVSTAAGWKTTSLIVSTGLGFVVGLIVNWVLSVKFVFLAVRDKEEARSKKSFTLFTVIGVIGLILTEVGVVLLVLILPEFSMFGRTEFLDVTWAKWLAKVIMTCIVLVWNYVGRKLFVFKS
ncbi:MAG: GtrA family protein [Clostridia bacterium]|nr:GtrA family protein [Clostridia bacterium]